MSQIYVSVSVTSLSDYFTLNILRLFADFLRLSKQMSAQYLEKDHGYFFPNHYIMHTSIIFSFSPRNTLQAYITNAAELGGKTRINLQNPSHVFTNQGLSKCSPCGGRRVYDAVKNLTGKIPLFEQFKLVLILPTGTKGHWVEDRIERLS